MNDVLAFFDRDGVLLENVKTGTSRPRAARSISEYQTVRGAFEVLDLLAQSRQPRIHIVVVTNQPDVASGEIMEESLNEIHRRLLRDFPQVSSIYCCKHSSNYRCLCRKPAVGMLELARAELKMGSSPLWMIGDRWSDIQAGRDFGCKTILINRDYSWEPSGGLFPQQDLKADYYVDSISEIPKTILQS